MQCVTLSHWFRQQKQPSKLPVFALKTAACVEVFTVSFTMRETHPSGRQHRLQSQK